MVASTVVNYSGSRLDAIHNRAQQCCAPTNGLYSMQLRTAIVKKIFQSEQSQDLCISISKTVYVIAN